MLNRTAKMLLVNKYRKAINERHKNNYSKWILI